MENWKEVCNTDGLYYVSNLGRVKRKKILKPTLMSVGYYSVALSVKGKVTREYIHKLVVNAFVGAVPVGKVIHHRDGDRLNNKLVNLEIVSRSDNGKAWAKSGRKNPTTGIKKSPIRTKPTDCNWVQSPVEGYEVSDTGNVWSNKTNRLLKAGTNDAGYQYYFLRKDGKGKVYSAHRLVIESFQGEIPLNLVVNHINHDKNDNRLANLEVISVSDNIRHSYKERP